MELLILLWMALGVAGEFHWEHVYRNTHGGHPDGLILVPRVLYLLLGPITIFMSLLFWKNR